MIYEFLDKDGNVVEISMSMREAPAIGSIIDQRTSASAAGMLDHTRREACRHVEAP